MSDFLLFFLASIIGNIIGAMLWTMGVGTLWGKVGVKVTSRYHERRAERERKRHMSFHVMYVSHEDHWHVHCKELPDLDLTADTRDELAHLAELAIKTYVEDNGIKAYDIHDISAAAFSMDPDAPKPDIGTFLRAIMEGRDTDSREDRKDEDQ